MATVQGQYSFYALRFLLGATEAGAVPIMLYYASCWTPQRDQGALFKISTLSWPLAVVIGAPLASLLMNHLHQVGGMAGWRWLFIAEGLPTVALGIFVLSVSSTTRRRRAGCRLRNGAGSSNGLIVMRP